LGSYSGPGSSTTKYSYQTDVGSGTIGNCNNCLVLGRDEDSVYVPGALQVTGAIQSTSGGIIFPDGTVQKTAANQAAATGNVITQVSGKVGVGTASPAAALDISGAGASSANLQFDYAPQPTEYWHSILNTFASGNGTMRFSLDDNGASVTPLTLTSKGLVGIGTTTPGASLEVNGNVRLTAGSGAAITFQDGTVQSTAYTGITSGGDYAEAVDVIGDRNAFEPGDLLVIDPANPGKFLKSNGTYSALVAGIYSTKPGTVGRRESKMPSPGEVPMALVGIVPVKVSDENGPIQVGDLLVSSSVSGRAMKGTDRQRMLGAVVGKALGNLETGTGTIEVLVTLR